MKENKPVEINADSIKGKLEELLNELTNLIPNEVGYRLSKNEFKKYINIAKEFGIDIKPFQNKYQEIIKRREER